MNRVAQQPLFVANRTVRRVPVGWQHPIDERGRRVPLLPEEMPLVGVDGELVVYETTTEGTPISPAFPDTPDGKLSLVRYCADRCTTFASSRADAEAWAVILFGDGAFISADGTVQAS